MIDAAPYIEWEFAQLLAPDPYHPDPAHAYVKGERHGGPAVWALVRAYQGAGSVEAVAEDYELPLDAVRLIVIDYYCRHRAAIDQFLAQLDEA